MKDTKIKLAFALAPLVPSLYFLVVLFLSDQKIAIVTMAFTLVFSYLPTLLFGLPLVFFLREKQQLSILNFVVYGALLGMIVFYIFGIIFSDILDSPRSVIPQATELLWGAFLGISVALPFGLIAGLPFLNIRSRP